MSWLCCSTKPAALARQAYATELARAENDQTLASALNNLHAREAIASTGIALRPAVRLIIDNMEQLAYTDGCMSASPAALLVLSSAARVIMRAHVDHARGWLFADAPRVAIAHDTRPSAPALLRAAQAGVEASGGAALLAGRPVTTPALHWAVRQLNEPGTGRASLAELVDRHLQSMREAYARLLTGAAVPAVRSVASNTAVLFCRAVLHTGAPTHCRCRRLLLVRVLWTTCASIVLMGSGR